MRSSENGIRRGRSERLPKGAAPHAKFYDEEKLLLLFITPQDLMTSTLISLSLSLSLSHSAPKKVR